MKAHDNFKKVVVQAEVYDGTAAGLTRVCAFRGVLPALGRIESEGATMICVKSDTMTLLPGDIVVAPGEKYEGGVFTPQAFEQKFTVLDAPLN
jgi:hypothetical protein